MTTPPSDTELREARTALGFDHETAIDPADLKARYRAAARESHPDVAGASATDLMAAINSAYTLLSEHPQPPAPASASTGNRSWRGSPRGRYSRQTADVVDAIRFDELLDDLRTIVDDFQAQPSVTYFDDGSVLVEQIPPDAVVVVETDRSVSVRDAMGDPIRAQVTVHGSASAAASAEFGARLRERRDGR